MAFPPTNGMMARDERPSQRQKQSQKARQTMVINGLRPRDHLFRRALSRGCCIA
jgi:hypothetical protein